jgi:RluA family pseudouridine synthase
MGKQPTEIRFTVEGITGEVRLDKVLKDRFPRWGRQAVGKVINGRQVKVNGKTVWLASWKVCSGDQITVTDPPSDKPSGPDRFKDSWIVAEEEDLIVVDKPAGLRSQATRAGGTDNLLSLAQARFSEVSLFHRLDRDTSGLCLLTYPGPVNAYLDQAFKQRLVKKEYLAVVGNLGELQDQGVITAALAPHTKRRDMMKVAPQGKKVINRQSAETRYQVEGQVEKGFLVRLWPVTGRTHQLRVHLAHFGAPIMGDLLYGGDKADRLMLHAVRLVLPETEKFPRREYLSKAEGFETK